MLNKLFDEKNPNAINDRELDWKKFNLDDSVKNKKYLHNSDTHVHTFDGQKLKTKTYKTTAQYPIKKLGSKSGHTLNTKCKNMAEYER